jgi:beta-mannosidase
VDLTEGWEVASTPPGACGAPSDLREVSFVPARVPGTAAGSLGADPDRDFDADDWWFRTAFAVDPVADGEQLVLRFEGTATVSEVFLNGSQILSSNSMWEVHEVDVTRSLQAENELVIVCRALRPLLAVSRRPRARWRTRVVADGNLRWYRTMLFGRSPGFAPGPAPVGPWRPVRLLRRGRVALESLSVRTRVEAGIGVVRAVAVVRGAPSSSEMVIGALHAPLRRTADGILEAELSIPEPRLWWPHTHGEPALHDVSVTLDGVTVASRRIGFRLLSWADDIASDGLDLHVNAVPVFVRGAVWTPADLVSLNPSPERLRALLLMVRDAGMNMLRVVGTGAYESPLFHDLCDELGILVWQDLMFANVDYPLADAEFRALVEREARQIVGELAAHPSLAVVCGNSEVEQQAAMNGLDPALGRGDFWESELPSIVKSLDADAAFVPSTPHGGALPFHANRGVTHYFGVTGYFRPTEDARRAEVRFAAECLAFANVPDEVSFVVHDPRWKAGVPRDAGTGWDLGSGWDFDDVRDHYLELLFAVDPVQLRRFDHGRYIELSRFASGEVMAELMGEWRRTASPCAGALVLWLKDMLPGAGLGVIDHAGAPKVAYHHLRRALAPVAVWMTDEGVNGIDVHIANDRAEPLACVLRVALYRDAEVRTGVATAEIALDPHTSQTRNVEALLGYFTDAAWAYRFGPPTHDVVAATLESPGDPAVTHSQAILFPAGRPRVRETAAQLGLELAASEAAVRISSRRLLYGVRIDAPGFVPDDDAFSVEPGGSRVVGLTRCDPGAGLPAVTISALNLVGTVSA